MFKTSESTTKLDQALAKAQGQIQIAHKDKINPAFRSKYADITSVWEACREALAKYEISVTQWPIHSEGNKLHLVTRIAHAGEWMQGEFSIPVTKPDAHGYGSAVTYAKRFALSAALGIVSDDEIDDDGNTASQTNRNPPRVEEKKVVKATPAAAPQKASEFDSVVSGVQAPSLSQYASWETEKLEAYMLEMLTKLQARGMKVEQLKGEPKAKFEAVQQELTKRGAK
jgi:hypothetical protein